MRLKNGNFNYMLSILKVIDGTPNKRNNILAETGEYCIHIISSDLLHWLYGEKSKRRQKDCLETKSLYTLNMICLLSMNVLNPTTERFKTLKRFNPEYLFLLSGTPFP